MVREIPLTQGKIALVDGEDYERVNQYKWQVAKRKNCWYAIHDFKKHMKDKTDAVLMHRFILSSKKGEEIDHINNNGLDNRKSNLRKVSHSQNMMNQRKTHGTSKYKGVSWITEKKKWDVRLQYNKKQIRMGYFIDEIEAAKCYDNLAKAIFGEYARLNFPETTEKVIEGVKAEESE